MKTVGLFFLSLFLIVSFTATGHACTVPVVTSFSLSPGSIAGDQSQLAIGIVQACLPAGSPNLNLYVALSASLNASQFYCFGGDPVEGGGCNYIGIGPGNVTVAFATNGYNYGGTDEIGSILVNASNGPPSPTQPLTITSASNPYEPPSQDPDGPCPTGHCNETAGHPINVTNGNTWIPQQDYFMPGIGGGLTLSRTWRRQQQPRLQD
jgi:hypothetical protein